MGDKFSEAKLPPPMFKLDVDGFEELFEWLLLADLLALRRTCKRLQKVVDYFIKLKYPRVQFGCAKIKAFQNISNSQLMFYTSKFIGIEKIEQLDPISLKMIKELDIWVEIFTEDKIDILKTILSQIEKISIIAPIYFEGEFYESFLKCCSNLKWLQFDDIRSNKIIGNDNSWLLRQYPSLERIELKFYTNIWPEIEEAKIFFQLNPTIKIFKTDFIFLVANQNWLLTSNIKIETLILRGMCNVEMEVNRACDLINMLYDQGFYKHVYMYCLFIENQNVMDKIASVRGIEKLDLYALKIIPTLSPIPSLRKMSVYDMQKDEELEPFAKYLVNLEQVHLDSAILSTVEMFLRYAKMLRRLRIDKLYNGTRSKIDIIDLVALNKERSKLIGAKKVTIYVDEKLYLSTKFAIANTELRLVMLKRAQAADWEQLYQSQLTGLGERIFGH